MPKKNLDKKIHLKEMMINRMGMLRILGIAEGRRAFSAGSHPPPTDSSVPYNERYGLQKKIGSPGIPSEYRGYNKDPNALQRLLRYDIRLGKYQNSDLK